VPGPDARLTGAWKLPVLSGALLGISYWPGPFLPLNLAAFVPLLLWLDQHGPTSPATKNLKIGFAFGLTTHLFAMHWMYSMLAESWLAILLYLGLSAALGLRIALSITLAGWLKRKLNLSWGVLLPIAWLPFEWAQTWGDLRFTGEHLAHTVTGYPFMIQFADITGPYGVGALLLATNGLIYESVRRSKTRRKPLLALAAIWLCVLTYDTWAWTRTETIQGQNSKTLRVAIIQPNIPLDVKHDATSDVKQWRILASLTRKVARLEPKPDLIVWPESARPTPLYHFINRPETYEMKEVQALAKEIGTPLLLGVEYVRLKSEAVKDYDIFNAAMAIDAEGHLLPEWTAKTYLVPFVEATPFKRVFGPLVEGRGGEWEWLAGGFSPPPETVVLDVAGTKIGVLVCYEEFFPDLSRTLRNAGAELQVVITNDAWFGRSLFQHYSVNSLRLRAIENRTAFVRAANTGISGFVDRRGRYAQRTKLFEEAVEVRDVEVSRGRTVYDRAGDVVAWVAVGGLLVAVGLGKRGR
jgi:apolipoprotein N-acyltransferase